MQSSQGGEIFKYTTTVSGYMGAPTCAMFVLAMFWNRTTEPVSIRPMRVPPCSVLVWLLSIQFKELAYI